MDQEEPMDCTVEENKKSRNKICLPYRGLAIIATFEKFRSRQLKDVDFAPDKRLLEKAFKKLQYGVEVWDEIMDRKTFLGRLKIVSEKALHKECETFALVILSHGDENGRIHAYDKDFSRQNVIDIFNAKNCPLKNKLKLFIFQACCGYNPGEAASGSPEALPPIVKLEKYIEKDNLILCSTREGTIAIGPSEDRASHFITTLTEVMNSEWSKPENQRKHIVALLTDVIGKTARSVIAYKEERNNILETKLAWQQPVMVLALTQLYYFEEKEVIPKEKLL